jgi:sulfate adenylyltransferase subunit 2
VDTTWKFRATYEMRDTVAERFGVDLIVYQNPSAGTSPAQRT